MKTPNRRKKYVTVLVNVRTQIDLNESYLLCCFFQFQLLAAVLFQKQHCVELSGDAKDVEVHIREQRIQLFDNLVEYFPSHMTQPKYNLRDVIQLRIEK